MADSRPPNIRYAGRGGASVAYSMAGSGSPLVEVPHVQMSHLSLEWQMQAVRHWCERLSRRHRLVRFDNRGGGLSAGQHTDFSLDALGEDIDSVTKAAGLDRFALFGRITGGVPAIAYAAAHPERVTHLILWNSFASHSDHGDNARMRSLFEMASIDWEMFTESISQAALGWEDASVARQWARLVRETSTQSEFLRYLEARRDWDVTPLLSSVKARTLVLYDRNNKLASAERSRELASRIPDAELMEVNGRQGMPDDQAIGIIEQFLGGIVTGTSVASPLTRRETEVLALVATGATNAEIARRLSISINTVTRHLTHIFDKIEVSNRAQAIRFALAHGIGQTTD